MDTTPTADRLTEAITARMGARGLTETALADASGIPRVTLRRRLTTGHGWKVDEIDRIADALGADPGTLFIAATTPAAEVIPLRGDKVKARSVVVVREVDVDGDLTDPASVHVKAGRRPLPTEGRVS